MAHSLYWHLATYQTGTAFRPARDHTLISLAGVEVQDESPESFEVSVWALVSRNVNRLIALLDEAVQRNERTVTMYGRHFGCPVVVANCIKQKARPSRVLLQLGNERVLHKDLAEEISRLAAPENNISFDHITDLFDLPIRPPIHKDKTIAQIWEEDDKELVRRIPQRLVFDCCCLCVLDSRLRWLNSEVSDQYRDNFEKAVLTAAGDKVGLVAKRFGVA